MSPLRFFAIVAAVLALLACGSWALGPAEAAGAVCLPRADLVEQLRETYGESLTARFLSSDGRTLFEVYTAPGSWTILVTDAAGTSCALSAGEAWVMQGVPQGEAG